MELPISPTSYRASPEALVRAVRQADLMLMRTAAQEVELPGARVLMNPQLPGVHMAHCAVELHVPAGDTAGAVVGRVLEQFVAPQRCYWMLSADVTWPGDLAQALEAAGYQRGPEAAVMRLQRWQPPSPPPPPEASVGRVAPPLQMLPARAVRAQWREMLEQAARQERHASADLAAQLAQWHLCHLDEPRVETIVARSGGQAVGYVNLISVGDAGVIDHLYTVPAWRRRGVATALLTHGLDWCARSGCADVILEVLAGTDTQRWYESLGFVAVARHHRYEKLP